ncbi:unnamed protein product [Cuscuta epithymum]|uniref:C3H1-type domain-containing protein n=1 Tax=Cuscuta epithymum TaxID=186058 RepID=A0AAV0G706_9ASTE|nr:unnamed protein product [Cuscuta epithymum]
MENCFTWDGTKPCGNPFRFNPPPSRRPLMSETCRTLFCILSSCSTRSELQHSQHIQGNGTTTTTKELVDQHLEAEIKLVGATDNEKNNGHAIWQDLGDIIDAQMMDCIDSLDQIEDSTECDAQAPQENGANNGVVSSVSLVDTKQDSTLDFQLDGEEAEKSNIRDLAAGESDFEKPQKMDTEISIGEACATRGSCLHIETESSQLVQSDQEKNDIEENDVLGDTEHGLQLKELELQNLISPSGPSNLSVSEEVEEGQISGDDEVNYQENGANNGVVSSDSLVDTKQDSTLDFQLDGEEAEKSNIRDLPAGESDFEKPQKMDTEISIGEACATRGSCLHIESESSQLVQSDQEKNDIEENDVLGDTEHGLQLKELELQNFISPSGPSNLSVSEEVEEGQISGDDEVNYYEPDDCMIFEEAVSLEQEIARVCTTAIKEPTHDVRDTKPQEKDVLTSVCNESKKCIREFSKKVEENDFETVECKNGAETEKVYFSFDNVMERDIVTNQIEGAKKVDGSTFLAQGFVTKTKDTNKMTKKNVRGPITEERKAKRKVKKKIKQAEKNRKLGVKRLKLPPQIMKPKKVSYCHHYLKGRCHEGEKCNFSHDTIPLTKSTPCCHFARNSCMKGDNCPYDHQLSKYPCNNFASMGFCSRGAKCLFSHDVPAKTESSKTPASAAHLGSPLLPCSLSPKMQVSANGSSPQLHLGEPMQKLAFQTPNGVSFITRGKSSLVKESGSGKFTQEEILSNSVIAQKPNDVMKERSPAGIPNGVNFLCFGGATLNDSTPNTNSNMLNRDGESKSGGICRIETRTEAPLKPTPRGISLLSFGKASSDGSTSKDQSILCSKEPNIATPVAPHERQNLLRRLDDSRNMQFKLLSSPPLSNQLYGQSTAGNSFGLPNSTFLASMLGSAQKAIQSTLAFSAKIEPGIKLDQSIGASVVTPQVIEHQ